MSQIDLKKGEGQHRGGGVDDDGTEKNYGQYIHGPERQSCTFGAGVVANLFLWPFLHFHHIHPICFDELLRHNEYAALRISSTTSYKQRSCLRILAALFVA